MATKNIIQISLEKILEAPYLENKEFVIKQNVDGNGAVVEILYSGYDVNNIYSGSKKFELSTLVFKEEIGVDDQGLPYLEENVGRIILPRYSGLFINNPHGFAASAAQTRERLLTRVLNKIKTEEHPLYKEFRKYLDNLIQQLPLIKEAQDRAYYFDDSKGLNQFSELDLKIFDHLTCNKFRDSDTYNPANHDIVNMRLEDISYVDIIRTKEQAAFILWYKEYMKVKGYKDKIEESSKKISETFKQLVNGVIETLEKNSFKRVEQLSYN